MTGNFAKLPPMLNARGYHSCLVMSLADEKDLIVVVVGGGTHKVETFSLKEQSWKAAQDFCDRGKCFQFLNAQGVSTPSGVLLFASLQDQLNEPTNYIFQMSCANGKRENCSKNFFFKLTEILQNVRFISK